MDDTSGNGNGPNETKQYPADPSFFRRVSGFVALGAIRHQRVDFFKTPVRHRREYVGA